MVIGGGLSGWAAAVTLTRAGREVLLAAERSGLGHEVSSALSLWPGDDRALPPSALTQEIADALSVVNALQRDAMDPVATQVLLDRLASEAEVKLLFQVWSHLRDSGEVMLTGKWGAMVASAAVIVDSTLNGALALEAEASMTERATDELPLRRALLINAQCDEDTEFPVGEDVPIVGGTVQARAGVWSADVILEARLELDSEDAAEFELQSRNAIIEAAARVRESALGFEVASLAMVAHESIMPRSSVIVGSDESTSLTELATAAGTGPVSHGALLPQGTEKIVLASPAAPLGDITAAECYQASNAVRIGEAAAQIAVQLLEA